MSYQSTVSSRGDGFGAQLRAEWTKFWSVRSTKVCTGLGVLLTIGLSVLASNAGGTDANNQPPFTDRFSLVYQPLPGDGSITARLASQANSHEWAKAGVIVKADTSSGSTYAALVATPAHGLRMEAEFTRTVASLPGAAPTWLRLTRTGGTVAGYTSPDGTTWHRVGGVTLAGLPATVQVGLMVASPSVVETVKAAGGSDTRGRATIGRAVFDSVTVQSGGLAPWRQVDIGDASGGSLSRAGGAFTVTGSGDISGYGIASWVTPGNDDTVSNSLVGLQFGLIAMVALGIVFAAAEYKTGIVRTTFAASPRRGRVLAAKAVVLGATAFVAGLLASVAAYLAAQPGLHSNGYNPPAYPHRAITEPTVLRAVVGAALVLGVLAVFGLAISTLLRRSVRSLALVLGLMLVPQIVGAAVLSLGTDLWLHRLTPVAGLAITQTRQRFDTAISPWGGFGVLAGYAAVALVAAILAVRRRDA
ncbi:MAG: ABC transporter permease subunit [Micromonosporaceae bacterium]|nr:ABC transporter permease subunit [Micromonosporaceae bacterium]